MFQSPKRLLFSTLIIAPLRVKVNHRLLFVSVPLSNNKQYKNQKEKHDPIIRNHKPLPFYCYSIEQLFSTLIIAPLRVKVNHFKCAKDHSLLKTANSQSGFQGMGIPSCRIKGSASFAKYSIPDLYVLPFAIKADIRPTMMPWQ